MQLREKLVSLCVPNPSKDGSDAQVHKQNRDARHTAPLRNSHTSSAKLIPPHERRREQERVGTHDEEHLALKTRVSFASVDEICAHRLLSLRI